MSTLVKQPLSLGAPKRVGLIIPPSAFLLDERVFVSLGALKIASALEAHGHLVHVLDLSGIKNYIEALSVYIDSCHDDVIGITSTTPQLPAVFEIAKAIRTWRQDLKLVLGGPHVTLTYSAVKLERKFQRGRASAAARQLESVFDVLVSGDGELAILHALQPNAPKVLDADDHKGPVFMSDTVFTASRRGRQRTSTINTATTPSSINTEPISRRSCSETGTSSLMANGAAIETPKMRRFASLASMGRQEKPACFSLVKRPSVFSQRASPRQHNRLPMKSAGGRIITKYGISSRQGCNTFHQGARPFRSMSLEPDQLNLVSLITPRLCQIGSVKLNCTMRRDAAVRSNMPSPEKA